MDLSHTHSQQVISQSLLQSTQLSSTTQPPLSTHTTTSDSSRALGSTTRARAAQQTLAKDNDSSESSSRQTRSNYQPYPSKRTRDTKAKGRSREITEEQPTLRSHKKYVPLTHHTYYSPYSSHLLHPSSHRARRTTYPVTSSALQRTHPRHKGQETCCPRNPLEDNNLSLGASAGPSKRLRSTTTAYSQTSHNHQYPRCRKI
jgi:hypothetical protein